MTDPGRESSLKYQRTISTQTTSRSIVIRLETGCHVCCVCRVKATVELVAWGGVLVILSTSLILGGCEIPANPLFIASFGREQ